MTRPGQWLQPRHAEREAFEKDFPALAAEALDASCPGCRAAVRLARRSPTGKLAGWCRTCRRGVCAT